MSKAAEVGYLVDRKELLNLRERRLLTSDQDYVFFALQIDFPGKLNPTVNVAAFCERWDLSIGGLYKALGNLKNKGVIVAIGDRLDLKMQQE